MNTLLPSYYVNLVGFPFLNLSQESIQIDDLQLRIKNSPVATRTTKR